VGKTICFFLFRMRLIGLQRTQIRRRVHCTMDGVTETVISAVAVLTIVSIYTMNMKATTATATTMITALAMIMISMGSKMLYWEFIFITQKYFSIADMI
jgi:hypothetical protein